MAFYLLSTSELIMLLTYELKLLLARCIKNDTKIIATDELVNLFIVAVRKTKKNQRDGNIMYTNVYILISMFYSP